MDITLSETQIKDAIVKMSNSEEYLELKKYYAEESFFKTLRVSRDEEVHSSFIAWLLNHASNHELNYYPLKKFLQMLSIVCQNENNSLAQFSEEYANEFLLEDYILTDESTVTTEEPTGEIADFDKNGRIDILLELRFKGSDKILPIIIENKVLSTENDETTKSNPKEKSKQTEKYFKWSKEKYADTDKYLTPILIFLAPDFERDIKCKCDAFIKVSYQNLVDYVIEPCLINVSNNQAKVFIENYLRCLSNTTINETLDKKEGRIMGFVSKEKELLEKFYEKNKDLFVAVLTMLSRDESYSDDERKSFKDALTTSSRDNSKYSLNGNEYRKGPLLVALVDKYIEDHPSTDVDELKRIFNLKLVFNKKTIILLPKDTPPALKTKAPERTLSDGTQIYINNQVQIGDMEGILRIAKDLGHTLDVI